MPLPTTVKQEERTIRAVGRATWEASRAGVLGLGGPDISQHRSIRLVSVSASPKLGKKTVFGNIENPNVADSLGGLGTLLIFGKCWLSLTESG
jgi:hypothetical protein